MTTFLLCLGAAWAAGTIDCKLTSTVMEVAAALAGQPADSVTVAAPWTQEAVAVPTHPSMKLVFPAGTVDVTATLTS